MLIEQEVLDNMTRAELAEAAAIHFALSGGKDLATEKTIPERWRALNIFGTAFIRFGLYPHQLVEYSNGAYFPRSFNE